jgi:hypothetical protein
MSNLTNVRPKQVGKEGFDGSTELRSFDELSRATFGKLSRAVGASVSSWSKDYLRALCGLLV